MAKLNWYKEKLTPPQPTITHLSKQLSTKLLYILIVIVNCRKMYFESFLNTLMNLSFAALPNVEQTPAFDVREYLQMNPSYC